MKGMGKSAIVLLGVLALVGCGDDDAGNTTTPTNDVPVPQVLVNPVLPLGGGIPPRMDEMARWSNYEGTDLHQGRATSVKWPNSLYTQYGCTPENTRCVVDGTEFLYYQIDVYPTGAQMLSYYSTRADVTFPTPFTAVLYKDGEPFAACQFPDPMVDNVTVRLPETITLPLWVNEVTL